MVGNLRFDHFFDFGRPRFNSLKFNTSERRTRTLPAMTIGVNRPRFISSLIDALDTSRKRAASACEIKSCVGSSFFLGIHNILTLLGQGV